MAQIVYGDREVFSQMMFGTPNPYLQNYVNQINTQFQGTLSNLGQQFIQSSRNLFTRIESSEAMQLAKAALRKINTYFQHDVIFSPTEISHLQEAPDSMVRWVMTHPKLRQLLHEGRIDGYGERYQPEEPNLTEQGWEHRDYARVYEGWVNPVTVKVEDKEEEYEEWVDVIEDDDIELITDEECLMIQDAHRLVDKALEENRDPTSYYDSQII